MEISITTPGLLFPAISLLFLSYTNRFLHLAALIRQLHDSWLKVKSPHMRFQIENLKVRLLLIRWMQLLGVASLLCCVISILALLSNQAVLGYLLFLIALATMGLSLFTLMIEIAKSGGALNIVLGDFGDEDRTT